MGAAVKTVKNRLPDLSRVPSVDEVGVNERVARFQTRSIKTTAKVEALNLILSMIDLTTLDSNTLIAPRETGRKLFVVKTSDSLQLYADFDDFVNALTLELNGANAARSMYARGHYNADNNVFTAYKVFIHILEP